jgi:hypothetical protein
MLNDINTVSNLLFTEFAKIGKYVAVHAENNILFIKVNKSETRILNWQSVAPEEILNTAKGLAITENYKGSVLLHG